MTRYMNQNDTRPIWQDVLRERPPDDEMSGDPMLGQMSGDAIDLTDATEVKLHVEDSKGKVFLEAVGAADPDQVNNTGYVSYTPQPGDFDTAGDFTYEWQITWSDGGVETVPTRVPMTLIVRGEIA